MGGSPYICNPKTKEIDIISLIYRKGSLAQLVQSIPIYNREGHWFKGINKKGSLAQLVQSIPIYNREGHWFKGINKKGSLAQLVQSICLTSRGSLVRTQ